MANNTSVFNAIDRTKPQILGNTEKLTKYLEVLKGISECSTVGEMNTLLGNSEKRTALYGNGVDPKIVEADHSDHGFEALKGKAKEKYQQLSEEAEARKIADAIADANEELSKIQELQKSIRSSNNSHLVYCPFY